MRRKQLDKNSCKRRVYIAVIRGGADKSLARPGRKQATATKLRIYATYSPRSSIHFLARCSNFCKPIKKKNQKVVSSTRSPRSPTGPDPENRVGDQDSGSSGRPVPSRLQVAGEPGHCSARTDPLVDLPAAFFLQNVLQLHQQR